MPLLLPHETVLTQNLAFPFIYLFFTWSESLYGSLRARKAKSLLKPLQLPWTWDRETFLVYKNINLQLK